MPVTRYHSFTGGQGRGIGGGYQGTRYESPLSTFVSRPQMTPAAETADETAQKAAAETPTPVDVVEQTEAQKYKELNPVETSVTDLATEVGDYAPANAFERAIDRETIGDMGLTGKLADVGVNTGLALAADVPLGEAAKAGFMQAMAPMAVLGDMIDTGVSGVAGSQVKGAYGGVLGDLSDDDIEGYRNLASLESEQYSPAPPDLETHSAVKDAFSERATRTSPLGPSLSPLGIGQIGKALIGKRDETIFGPVKSAEKYKGLVAKDMYGNPAGGSGAVPGTTDVRDLDSIKDAFGKEYGALTKDSYQQAIARGFFDKFADTPQGPGAQSSVLGGETYGGRTTPSAGRGNVGGLGDMGGGSMAGAEGDSFGGRSSASAGRGNTGGLGDTGEGGYW